VAGDATDPSSLRAAFDGVEVAYYLVHSMGSGRDFAERDRKAALVFADAARAAGLRRVIYLGGLGHGTDLSAHLASRQEVGRILRETLPTIELRASIIVGSGSLSFEVIRALVDRLPVMITPRWVRTKTQPIAIEDVIAYLVAALGLEAVESRVYEIGGSEVASYGEVMMEYARQRGLVRHLIPVPFLTPWLSSQWLALVTPVYARIGRELILGLENATTVQDPSALRDFPVRPRSMVEAIARALLNEDREFAATRWNDAPSSVGTGWGGKTVGRRLIDSRTRTITAAPRAVFDVICRLGGKNGWYHATWLWNLRGFLDSRVGGPGVRRGRRHPADLFPGDTVDWWRVEALERDKLLRLVAEMRAPGRAWLQFELEPEPGGATCLRQTALFDPAGLAGLVYWYLLWPVHQFVFSGLLRGIAERASSVREQR
jgi:uncharacterized protein YbjT (DUF2867 family)